MGEKGDLNNTVTEQWSCDSGFTIYVSELMLYYHVSDSDKISLPLTGKLAKSSSDPAQVSFGDTGLLLWTCWVSIWY